MLRGLQVVETAIAATTTLMGDKIEGEVLIYLTTGLEILLLRISEQGYGHVFQEASPRCLRQHFPLQLPCVRGFKPVRLQFIH